MAAAPIPVSKPTLTKEEEVQCAKYSKMKKMKLPEAAIRNKMKQDGIDKSLVAKFFGDNIGLNTPSAPTLGSATGPKIKAKPKWPDGLKKKPELKPGRKMRNLQWNKIDPFSVKTSIWNEVDDTKIKFDTIDFENMFGQKVVAKKVSKSGGGKKKKAAAIEKIHIL